MPLYTCVSSSHYQSMTIIQVRNTSAQGEIIVFPHSSHLDCSISSLKQINCPRLETELKPAESCENYRNEGEPFGAGRLCIDV